MYVPVLVQIVSRPIWNVIPGPYISSAASRERCVPITGAGNPGYVSIPSVMRWLRSISIVPAYCAVALGRTILHPAEGRWRTSVVQPKNALGARVLRRALQVDEQRVARELQLGNVEPDRREALPDR